MKRILVLAAALALSSTAVAQQNNRGDTWEFGLMYGNLGSDSLSGDNGSSIDIDSSAMWGLILGYNFNSHFSLAGEFSWAKPDYEALIIPDDGFGNPLPPESIRHQASLFSYGFKGTFNLLKGPFTPYAELGFGWTEMDSNVADQPPITGCWWDPWWGYVCDTFWSTYSKTRESYTGAIGLRYDVANGMTVKGSYGQMQINTSGSTEDANMDYYRLELSWRF